MKEVHVDNDTNNPVKKKLKHKKNIHEGHRKRLFEIVRKHGFDALSKYQQVEFLLFFVHIVKDTNPLAHRLLDYFGSFSAILDADYDDLLTIPGVGKMGAERITSVVPMFRAYNTNKIESRIKIVTYSELYGVLKESFEGSNVEETFAISMDNSGHCNGIRRLAVGDINTVCLEFRQIFKFLDTYKSHAIYLAHNHPGGNSQPSSTDLESFKDLKDIVERYGTKLEDFFIVSPKGIFSLSQNRIVKEFLK